jgi:hypothetical protein
MAELTVTDTTAANPCCAPEQQASCCESSAKADCCGREEGCGCDARAHTRALLDAGLTDVEIREGHRVHPQAVSAIVRARKPHG